MVNARSGLGTTWARMVEQRFQRAVSEGVRRDELERLLQDLGCRAVPSRAGGGQWRARDGSIFILPVGEVVPAAIATELLQLARGFMEPL